MEIKNVRVYGLKESIVRSGYPTRIGELSIFEYDEDGICGVNLTKHGERAYRLAKTPIGSGHDNFLKGIIVQFDLQYPEYFSPQLQRYNWIDIISSQSKMHKITSRKLTKEDFTEYTHEDAINNINSLISIYQSADELKINKEVCFNQIISNLPSGYLKWMGISTNYLQLKTIYSQRKNHKLQEWRYFCNWIETLPQSELITNLA